MSKYIDRVLAEVKEKNANEPEFLQTVEEVLGTLAPIVDAHIMVLALRKKEC